MRFLNLEIENFLSWEKASIPLSEQGLVLVCGQNLDSFVAGSNGSGKSALIVDALHWVLYGRTPRKVAGSSVVRRNSTSGCKGIMTLVDSFNQAFRVTRYQDHPYYKNELFLNRCVAGATEELTKSDKHETQADIERLLGFPMQVLLNAVVLGQNSIAFATMTDAEKKTTFEKVLEFDRLTRAEKRARERVKELEVEISGKQTLVFSYSEQLKNLELRLEELQGKSKKWREEQELEKNKLKTRLAEVKWVLKDNNTARKVAVKELLQLRDEEKALEKVHLKSYKIWMGAQQELKTHDAISGLSNNHKLESDVRARKADYERCFQGTEKVLEFSHSHRTEAEKLKVDETCPTCKQVLPKDQILQLRNEFDLKIQQAGEGFLGTLIETFTSRVAALEACKCAADELTKSAQKLSIAQLERRRLNQGSEEAGKKTAETAARREGVSIDMRKKEEEIQSVEEIIADFGKEESSLKVSFDAARENPFKVAIEGTVQEISRIKVQLGPVKTVLQQSQRKLVLCEFWVRGFGKSGIQSYMLDSLVPYLNERIFRYANMMFGGEVTIEFKTQRLLADGKTLKEDFHVAVENRNGSDTYLGGSGGEQERIDICIALGLQDLIASRRGGDFTLCILDEVGKHLDAEGQELYYQLLQELAREKDSIFVITHSPHLESMFDRVWTVRKKNGVSELVI